MGGRSDQATDLLASLIVWADSICKTVNISVKQSAKAVHQSINACGGAANVP